MPAARAQPQPPPQPIQASAQQVLSGQRRIEMDLIQKAARKKRGAVPKRAKDNEDEEQEGVAGWEGT